MQSSFPLVFPIPKKVIPRLKFKTDLFDVHSDRPIKIAQNPIVFWILKKFDYSCHIKNTFTCKLCFYINRYLLIFKFAQIMSPGGRVEPQCGSNFCVGIIIHTKKNILKFSSQKPIGLYLNNRLRSSWEVQY